MISTRMRLENPPRVGWSCRCALACVLGSFLLPDSAADGQDALAVGSPLPQEVADNWTARQAETDALKCVFEWRRLIPQGTYNDDFITPVEEAGVQPPEDVWLENSYTMWLDFAAGRARVEYEGFIFHSTEDFHEHVPLHMISLFDGENLQLFEPAENNPRPNNPYPEELQELIPGGRYEGFFLEPVAYPVFFGQGILTGPLGGITADRIRRPIDRSLFRAAASGDAETGRPLLLESTPFGRNGQGVVEVTVDLKRDFVITRWGWYLGGTLRQEHLVEPVETERGWMPDAWTFAIYAPSGDVLERSECRVTERIFDPDLSAVAFHVEPSPGTFYRDERTGESYYVATAGERLPRAEAIRQIAAQQEWRSRLVAIGIAAVLLLAGAWWIMRRRSAVA